MFPRSKNVCVIAIWVVIGLNVIYFAHRLLFSDSCNLEMLLNKSHNTAVVAVGHSSGLAAIQHVHNSSCLETSSPWCMYKDEVDLRIIILTFRRHESLLRLLSSVNDLELDGDSVAVEIWIDRDKRNNVHTETLAVANSFQWKHGSVTVHIQPKHAGIYGQWIYTWRPWNTSTREMALILEDDISMSPFAYRWLRAASRFYSDRKDIAGLTLQSEGLIIASSGGPFTKLPSAAEGAAYLSELMGSWGFVPRANVWIGFQNWFTAVHPPSGNSTFKPYVSGLVMTSWYKGFERSKKEDSMWTMWFIYYYSQAWPGEGHLYTIFSNIGRMADNVTGRATCVGVNRREPGLHFAGKAADNTGLLLRTWKKDFERFNRSPAIFSFQGQRVN